MRTIIIDFPENSKLSDLKNIQNINGFELKTSKEVSIILVESKDVNKIVKGELYPEEENIILRSNDWKIIPLENLIAALHSRGKKIGVVVNNPKEVPALLNILEKGVDSLYFESKDIFNESVEYLKNDHENISVKTFKITGIEDAGSGDRVCIDTISMLGEDEGLFIGSFASSMLLILSENSKNEFIDTRPFRVNSGSIHQYVYVGNGKTKYLSELNSGTKIEVFNKKGIGRGSTVGRAKIEFRPLLKISFTDGKIYGSVFLQNAETVRLMGKDGNPIQVNKLKEGDEVLGISLEGARHYGMKIEEKMIEI